MSQSPVGFSTEPVAACSLWNRAICKNSIEPQPAVNLLSWGWQRRATSERRLFHELAILPIEFFEFGARQFLQRRRIGMFGVNRDEIIHQRLPITTVIGVH
jgi:hypothetical protein